MHATSSEKTVEERTRHVLSEIFAGCRLEKVGFRLWDDSAWPDDRLCSATLILKHPGALGRMFLPGTEVGLAEAYLRNDFDIEGNIEAAFEVGDFLLSCLDDWKKKLKLGNLLIRLPEGDGRSTIQTWREATIATDSLKTPFTAARSTHGNISLCCVQ